MVSVYARDNKGNKFEYQLSDNEYLLLMSKQFMEKLLRGEELYSALGLPPEVREDIQEIARSIIEQAPSIDDETAIVSIKEMDGDYEIKYIGITKIKVPDAVAVSSASIAWSEGGRLINDKVAEFKTEDGLVRIGIGDESVKETVDEVQSATEAEETKKVTPSERFELVVSGIPEKREAVKEAKEEISPREAVKEIFKEEVESVITGLSDVKEEMSTDKQVDTEKILSDVEKVGSEIESEVLESLTHLVLSKEGVMVGKSTDWFTVLRKLYEKLGSEIEAYPVETYNDTRRFYITNLKVRISEALQEPDTNKLIENAVASTIRNMKVVSDGELKPITEVYKLSEEDVEKLAREITSKITTSTTYRAFIKALAAGIYNIKYGIVENLETGKTYNLYRSYVHSIRLNGLVSGLVLLALENNNKLPDKIPAGRVSDYINLIDSKSMRDIERYYDLLAKTEPIKPSKPVKAEKEEAETEEGELINA